MDVKNKVSKACNQMLNCPHGSLIIPQTFQRAMCKGKWQSLSLPGWKILQKSLKSRRFLPRFQALALLFLRNSYLSKNLITIFGNAVRQQVSADLSRLEIWDLDKANQNTIPAHLFCLYSSCDRNNMRSLQRQIHFNAINHWGPTATKRVDNIEHAKIKRFTVNISIKMYTIICKHNMYFIVFSNLPIQNRLFGTTGKHISNIHLDTKSIWNVVETFK